jgi:hypothetical protein
MPKFAPTDEQRKIVEKPFLARTRHGIKINLSYDFGSFVDCCARAASGHAAAAPPMSVLNSRRFTRSPRRR